MSSAGVAGELVYMFLIFLSGTKLSVTLRHLAPFVPLSQLLLLTL